LKESSKKLSIFLPSLYAGGAERSMLKLSGGLAAKGYPVDLVIVKAEGPLMAEVPNAVRVVDLCSSRVLMSLLSLIRYLRKERPVALLSVLHANFVAILAHRLAHVPTRIIVSERNTLSIESRQSTSDFRMRLMPLLARFLYSWADGVVTVSKGVKNDLTKVVKIQNELTRVIYNPIVTPELRVKASDSLIHPWFKPDEPPVILAVGRLTAQKDFVTLIKAFARVRKNYYARLIILGEGEDRGALETIVNKLNIKNDVRLPGFVLNPLPYMVRASLFVLSSRWEGLPGVLIEAMYCGVPIISTDCPSGPNEILRNGQYGKLVPVGDVAALTKAMTAGLNGKIQRPPTDSWQDFELEIVVNQYLNTLLGAY
jgi:glycosyltransferase involved in cell wall biosynthesis